MASSVLCNFLGGGQFSSDKNGRVQNMPPLNSPVLVISWGDKFWTLPFFRGGKFWTKLFFTNLGHRKKRGWQE